LNPSNELISHSQGGEFKTHLGARNLEITGIGTVFIRERGWGLKSEYEAGFGHFV